jgi:hypothetical protein
LFRSRRSDLLAVGLQPRIGERDAGVDHRVMQPFLGGDQLYQFVRGAPFWIARAAEAGRTTL